MEHKDFIEKNFDQETQEYILKVLTTYKTLEEVVEVNKGKNEVSFEYLNGKLPQLSAFLAIFFITKKAEIIDNNILLEDILAIFNINKEKFIKHQLENADKVDYRLWINIRDLFEVINLNDEKYDIRTYLDPNKISNREPFDTSLGNVVTGAVKVLRIAGIKLTKETLNAQMDSYWRNLARNSGDFECLGMDSVSTNVMNDEFIIAIIDRLYETKQNTVLSNPQTAQKIYSKRL